MSPLLMSFLGAMVAGNLVVTVLLWRQMSKLDRRLRQQNTTIQKQEREITQQRYALAMLRQLQKGEGEEEKSDEERLNEAVSHLDAVADAEQKKAESEPQAQQEQKDVAVGGLKEEEILSFVKKAIKNNQIAVS